MLHDLNEELSNEAAKFYVFLFAIAALIVCTIGSCSELQYMSSGRVVAAPVEKTYIHTNHPRNAPDYDTLVIMYTITEPQPAPVLPIVRHEVEEVDPDWYLDHPADISADKKFVQVQYLPMKEGRSRLLGNSHRWLIIPFFASLAFIVGAAIWFWRDFAIYQRRLAEGR